MKLLPGATVTMFTALLALAMPKADAKSADRQSRPNFLIIYTDDQDVTEMGCYGGHVSTPNMDRLAHEGVRFTRFYLSSSLCSPSRYTALTGQYVSRSRGLRQECPTSAPPLILWNSPFLPDDFTIARALKRSGYVTGMVGKWHNGLPEMADVATDADPRDPDVAAVISQNYAKLCGFVRARAGFDYAESIYGTNFRWLPIPESLMFHNQEWLTKGAVDFIEDNADRPFFLYVATTVPHYPIADASLRADLRATPAGWLDEAPEGLQPSRKDVLRRTEKARKDGRSMHTLWSSLAWLDDGVGALLNKLDTMGLAGNTVVILASDNERLGKMSCNLGKAPCLIRWPGRIPRGKICDKLVSNIDIVPTILDACGVQPPPGTRIDGRSWLPLLKDPDTKWRDSLYLEVTRTRGVVTRDWKYIATRFPKEVQQKITPENRRKYNQEGALYTAGSTTRRVAGGVDKFFPGYYDDDQLYDLRSDPGEQSNLAGNPVHADTLREMKERLRAYSQELPHPFGEFKSHSGNLRDIGSSSASVGKEHDI